MAGPKHGCDAKKLNEMFREERGQLRYKIVVPRREGPVSVKGQVKRWEIVIRGEITSDMAAAMGLVIGSPFCALAAKRILPGLGCLSDDAVMAAATSASVASHYFKSSRRSQQLA
uniref:Uncharacterized protein n=1 Tax=Oryza punctata TaxID=4537 RepID=A0A0E0JTR4_ORYPU